MVKSFDTTGNPSKSGGSSSTKIIIGLLVLAAIGYGYYRFVYLPKQTDKKDDEQN